MVSLQISGLKGFMNKLLLTPTFDHFLLAEAAVTTYNTFYIDGHLQKDFFTKEELEDPTFADRAFSYWEQVRPFCLELMKGRKTPLGFKIVFQLSRSNTERLLQKAQLPYAAHDVNGLFLNLKYDGSTLNCITGTSMALFTLDKSLEHKWDSMVQKFFLKQGIDFDVL